MKLGGLLRPYPVNISPKDLVLKINESRELWGRSKGIGVFSRTQEIEFEHASDSRGFRTELEARESQQRTRSLLSIKCAKNEIENPLHKAQKKVSTIHGQNQLKREEQREGDAGAAAWRNRESTNRLQKPQLT